MSDLREKIAQIVRDAIGQCLLDYGSPALEAADAILALPEFKALGVVGEEEYKRR